MDKKKSLKLLAYVFSIGGLIFMFVSWVKWNNMKLVALGLAITCIGLFIDSYAKKKA